MRSLRHATLPLLLAAACTAHAQTNEIEVNDGTNATCYGAQGSTSCGFFTSPTIDTLVDDGAGKFSEITTTSGATSIRTDDGGTWSGLNVAGAGTALESHDGSDRAVAGTQTGVSSITGLASGQFIATGENASQQDSSIELEGTVGFLRTRDAAAGTVSFYQSDLNGTMMGYAENGAPVSTITSDANGHRILGNTALTGTLAVTGASTLNGIDNQNAGISAAGAITGVVAGVVDATSTDAVNGSQLNATNVAVAAAQTTADTAVTNAAAAQTTADTALTNAATAQTMAGTALTNAATAQTTADTALINAATAQTTADSAVTNAASAQTTADTALTNAATAQTTADTAVTNAATAQTSANTAQTTADAAQGKATQAQAVATTASANAADARSVADNARASAATAQATANTAMTGVAGAVNTANVANANALSAYSLAAGLTGRVSSLEGRVQDLASNLQHVDEMAGRGIAIATALASVPDLEPGKTAGLGIGVGSYDGHNAVSAAFVVRASENAKFRVNGGTAGDGKFAFGAGGMFSW